MRLKRLEAFGFKSFADRMEFEFGAGLTGIVGPNGCGKSNVVDAIRWVLGEQRPTQLRGSEMTDVIFKGTSSRQALGFAEVTVVLDNEGGGLPSEFSEVSLTRRLFRTGESEYLLNRQPARLKDLRELLLDTGLGVHSYTILEQGRIDAILSANPIERRAIFEEAAGIGKFRLRRKEAVRRIEQVQQNLLRLNDLLAELESGIRSLKIQASKVRRYREFHERLRELKVQLSLHLFRARSRELEEARRLREEREASLAAVREKREKLEAEIRLLEEEVRLQSDEIARASRSLEAAKSEESQASDRIGSLEVRIGEWQREKFGAEERLAATRDLLAEKEAEGTKLLGSLERSREELAAIQRKLEEAEGAAREAVRVSRETFSRLQEAEKEVLEFLHLRTEAQNRRVELESGLKGLEASRERLLARRGELAQTLAWRRDREHQLEGEKQSLESREKEVEASLAERRQRREALESEYAEKERVFLETEQRLSALSSRQQVLKELAEGREGLDAGVKALLGEAGEFSLLADRLQVELRFARALETALFGRAQSLVVFDPRAAASGMERLRRNRSGRAAFALAGRAGPAAGVPEIPRVPGVIGRLSDQVRCEAGLRPLLEQWIGDCALVEDPERAAALSERHPGLRFVTPAGDLFGADLWIGGEEARESGPISRRSLLEALGAELQALRADRDLFAISREELRRSIEAARGDEERLERQQAALAKESAVRGAGVEQARGEIARIEEEKLLTEKELAGIEDETGKAAELVRHFAAEWESLERRFQEANGALQRLGAEKAAQDQRKEEAARAEGEIRLEVERLRGVEQKVLGQRELLAAALEELRREGERLAGAIAEIEGRSEVAKREIDELHQSRARSLEERSRIESQLQGLREREEALETAVRERRAELESQSQGFEVLLSQLSEARLSEQKIQMTRDEIASRIREEFQVELEQVAQERPEDPSFQPAAAEQEIADLRGKIDRLGSINLDAIRELEEKEGRFQFLTGQKNDLEESRKLLHETIQKIDAESRERFAATFQTVREQFQSVFRQLFRGGKADLELEEGADLLEAGIQIQAKPPGKELRNIDLLSGGERTLTALALLFALFRSKPSPFCLLDEVDAALDDANIERFLGVLREFTKESQFVLVTHNKRTMASCNLLYGVTMQDNGVSKKVAVELGEEGEEIRFVSPKKALVREEAEASSSTAT